MPRARGPRQSRGGAWNTSNYPGDEGRDARWVSNPALFHQPGQQSPCVPLLPAGPAGGWGRDWRYSLLFSSTVFVLVAFARGVKGQEATWGARKRFEIDRAPHCSGPGCRALTQQVKTVRAHSALNMQMSSKHLSLSLWLCSGTSTTYESDQWLRPQNCSRRKKLHRVSSGRRL